MHKVFVDHQNETVLRKTKNTEKSCSATQINRLMVITMDPVGLVGC